MTRLRSGSGIGATAWQARSCERGPVTPKHGRCEGGLGTPKHRRCEGGFSLLEVLIAMCVLLIALASILPLFAVGTASHKRGVDQTVISMAAPQVVALLQENLTTDRPQDVKDGEIVFQGLTYRYDATFEPLDKHDPLRLAFIVRIAMKWNEAGTDRAEQFDTLLVRRTPRGLR